MTSGLKKYVEWLSRGKRTGRAAYALRERHLPMPMPGAEWQVDARFNAAEAILITPDLKAVLSVALKDGVAVVFQNVKLGVTLVQSNKTRRSNAKRRPPS
jgi:hypothetical protein